MSVLNIDRRINLKKEYQSVKEDFAEAVLDRAEEYNKKRGTHKIDLSVSFWNVRTCNTSDGS